MNKLISHHDAGELVAVIYSPGYGAGWSTWNGEHPEMLFDRGLADMIIAGKSIDEMLTYCEATWPDGFFEAIYDGLSLAWLPVDTKFTVIEHDGNEYILTQNDLPFTA